MESENIIEVLKQEHEQIERELLELEAIMEQADINYENLVHIWKILYGLWNEHEEKEEKIFTLMEKERLKMPVEKMLFTHKELRVHKKAINEALISGSNENMKRALDKSGKIIIEKLREHMDMEDEILYTVTLEEFSSGEILSLLNPNR